MTNVLAILNALCAALQFRHGNLDLGCYHLALAVLCMTLGSWWKYWRDSR